MTESTLTVRVNHTGYDCVLCQQWHDAGSATIARHPHYEAHLYRQSKHGIQTWTETRCYRVDEAGKTAEVPACEVLPAGEY